MKIIYLKLNIRYNIHICRFHFISYIHKNINLQGKNENDNVRNEFEICECNLENILIKMSRAI